MKRSLMSIAAAVGFAIAQPTLLPAQSAGLVYNVPFAFSASGVKLAAGTYVASTNQQSGVLRGHGGGFMYVVMPDLTAKPSPAHLTFYKYGESYVLREVWQSDGTGRKIRVTSREQEILKAAERPAKIELVASR
jgi:hypothetical protein